MSKKCDFLPSYNLTHSQFNFANTFHYMISLYSIQIIYCHKYITINDEMFKKTLKRFKYKFITDRLWVHVITSRLPSSISSTNYPTFSLLFSTKPSLCDVYPPTNRAPLYSRIYATFAAIIIQHKQYKNPHCSHHKANFFSFSTVQNHGLNTIPISQQENPHNTNG